MNRESLKPVGFYDIDGVSKIGGPLLSDLVQSHPQPNQDKIVEYLNHGICVAGCGGVAPDVLSKSSGIWLNMDLYTDGDWEWPAYLAYYVQTYHISLPEDFVLHMHMRKWIVSEEYVNSMLPNKLIRFL